jgi:hypothetical protein
MFDKGFFNGYAEGSITTGEYGMPGPAITKELHLIIQTASFTRLSDAVLNELVIVLTEAALEHAKKRDYLVGTVSLQTGVGK